MRRVFWVAVGAAAGIYAVRKVQKTLHAYSASGLAERAGGLGDSLRLFADEVRAGMAERESELRVALGIDEEPRLTPAEAAEITEHPGRPRRTPKSSRSAG